MKATLPLALGIIALRVCLIALICVLATALAAETLSALSPKPSVERKAKDTGIRSPAPRKESELAFERLSEKGVQELLRRKTGEAARKAWEDFSASHLKEAMIIDEIALSTPSPEDRASKEPYKSQASCVALKSGEKVYGRILAVRKDAAIVSPEGAKKAAKEQSVPLASIASESLYLFDKDAWERKLDELAKEKLLDWQEAFAEIVKARRVRVSETLEAAGFGWSSQSCRWVPLKAGNAAAQRN